MDNEHCFQWQALLLEHTEVAKEVRKRKNMLFSEAPFSNTLLGKVFAISLTPSFIIITIFIALVVAAAVVGYGCWCYCCCCCRLWVL